MRKFLRPFLIVLACCVVVLIVVAIVRGSTANTPQEQHDGVKLTNAQRRGVERLIRSRINELSSEPAVLGGTFYVTDIRWQEDNTAKVYYEDGHIALSALAVPTIGSGSIAIESFKIDEQL
jgi:hypothetical protein